jgi:Holliday junction resolvasome RuvABC DNA-binding subunit
MDTGQAIAFATVAMKNLGYKQTEIEAVTNAMLEEIETHAGEYAVEKADEILYGEDENNI